MQISGKFIMLKHPICFSFNGLRPRNHPFCDMCLLKARYMLFCIAKRHILHGDLCPFVNGKVSQGNTFVTLRHLISRQNAYVQRLSRVCNLPRREPREGQLRGSAFITLRSLRLMPQRHPCPSAAMPCPVNGAAIVFSHSRAPPFSGSEST